MLTRMTTIRNYIYQYSRDTKSLPTLVSVLLGAALLLTLIFSLQQWYADWVIAHASKTSAYISTKNETAEMIAAIPDEHLFGQNLTESGNAPISNLGLKVTGIVKIDEPNAQSVSKVYISISGKPSKIFRVGDELADGVKVYDITSDTVILDNDGHIEKLPLPREGLTFKPRDREGE